MAQIIPPITSLPIDSLAAPSAEDIQDRLPSICVDYLSHDWSEEDVWASWRSMTRHKHEIANGVRLENASWRTWNKQRNKLKTISPETLNWLKDSDVTWLYGPLHTAAVEPVRPLKVSATDDRLGLDRPVSKKPILKHRTLSEMLTIPTPASPILEASQPDSGSESDDGAPHGNAKSSRPVLIQTRSDTNIANSRTSGVRVHTLPKPPQGILVSEPRDASHGESPVVSPGEGAKEKKHISFNTFVEQCQAIPDNDLPIAQQPTADSDDEMLEIKSNSSRSSRSSRPSLSRQSSSASGTSEHLTIAMIAPTMLKTNGSYVSSNMPQMVYAPPPEYQSPSEEVARSPRAQMQARNQDQQAQGSSHDFPSPTMRKQQPHEDDDEYGSAGYDYFEGPSYGSQTAPVHIGGYGRDAPQVAQPPNQPKWRQQGGSTQSSEPSSVSSSSSASLNNYNHGVTSPPVPSRGILKVRQPGSTPPEPASPPQSSYFNYNPSPATGIGGMRGSYEYPNTLDAQAGHGGNSPLLSPATQETRGRSAQRQAGSTMYDRSASRGTSASSASMSPGAVRTPPAVDSGRAIQVRSPPLPPQVNAQVAAPPPQPVIQATAAELRGKQEMDVDQDAEKPYEPERSNTPTPHSSPQISLRPLKDTSPASLPHTSSRPDIHSAHSTSSSSTPTTASTQVRTPTTGVTPGPAANSAQSTSGAPASRPNPGPTQTVSPSSSAQSITRKGNAPDSPELPKADPPTSISPPSRPLVRSNSGGRRTARASTSGKATIAHVGTNAQPTLSQPPQDGLPQDRGQAGQWAGTFSLGQASNAASGSAAQSGGAGMRRQGSGQSSSSTQSRHRTRDPAADDGYDYNDDDLSDGGSIMGRAANIASSARELLGGWWYGDNGAVGGQQAPPLHRQLSDQAGQGAGRGGKGPVAGAGGVDADGGQADQAGQGAQQTGSSRGPWGKHRRGTSLG